MKRILKVLILGLVVTIELVGCSSLSQPVPKETETTAQSIDFEKEYPTPEIRAYAKDLIGNPAPDFKVTDLAGKTTNLSNLKGKNVVLDLAKTTCSACIHNFPVMQEMKKMHTDTVFLTIFPTDTKTAVDDFFAKNNYPVDSEVVAGNGNNSIMNDYKIRYTPTHVFINTEGVITYVHIGGFQAQDFTHYMSMAFGL